MHMQSKKEKDKQLHITDDVQISYDDDDDSSKECLN